MSVKTCPCRSECRRSLLLFFIQHPLRTQERLSEEHESRGKPETLPQGSDIVERLPRDFARAAAASAAMER